MPLDALPALAGDLARVAARLRASTVAVHAGTPAGRGREAAGFGSGVVWRAAAGARDGLVVTNAHVARTAYPLVTLPDGRRLAARVLARDPGRDLALLAVDADALPPGALVPAERGDPARLRPGELVFALGHPLGHAHSLAAGVVHAAGEAAAPPWLRGAGRGGVRVVRADVRLLPGNSGGPLADAAGRVVGINTLVAAGLGVAVSVDEVDALVARVAAAGAPAGPRAGGAAWRAA